MYVEEHESFAKYKADIVNKINHLQQTAQTQKHLSCPAVSQMLSCTRILSETTLEQRIKKHEKTLPFTKPTENCYMSECCHNFRSPL